MRGHLRETLSRHPFQQKPESDETKIAINDSRARFVFQIKSGDNAKCSLGFALSEDIQRAPCRKPGSVRQQFSHCDHMFIGTIEFGEVMRDRAVRCQLSGLNSTRA